MNRQPSFTNDFLDGLVAFVCALSVIVLLLFFAPELLTALINW